MIIAASIAAIAAGALHVFIFVLESILWDSDFTRTTFSIADPEESRATRSMAFNQGFYNLFLAIGATLGIVLFAAGGPDTVADVAGRTLLLFSLGSMTAAALVLLMTGGKYLRAALVQGTLPLIGFVLFLFA